MTTGSRVIGYVRVSTADQGSSGLGLAAQRAAIEAECKRRGWTLVRIEQDVQSGRSTRNRPGLRRALSACHAGDAAGIVFAKLDRATRSLADFSELVKEAERGRFSLVATDGSCDMTSSMGRAMAGMSAVFAQLERDLISERTKLAMQAAKKQGRVIGRPSAVPAQARQQMQRMRDQGKTWQAIADWCNKQGVPTGHGASKWWPSTVRAALQSV